jgi:transposase
MNYEMTPAIHSRLAERDLLPGEHLFDKGYRSADNLVESHERQIDLVGPVAEDPSWQAQADEGFASAVFVID